MGENYFGLSLNSKFKVCEHIVDFIECDLERNVSSLAGIVISKIEEY